MKKHQHQGKGKGVGKSFYFTDLNFEDTLSNRQLRIQRDDINKMQLNWGIIGAGNVAHDFCVALRTLPSTEHKVVAIGSRSFKRTKEFASVHKIEQCYGSYNELLEDADVNIVYVATVNSTHKPIVLQALNHNKHVLCEKPMGVNKAEVEEIVRFAKQKQLFIMEVCISSYFAFILPHFQNVHTTRRFYVNHHISQSSCHAT